MRTIASSDWKISFRRLSNVSQRVVDVVAKEEVAWAPLASLEVTATMMPVMEVVTAHQIHQEKAKAKVVTMLAKKRERPNDGLGHLRGLFRRQGDSCAEKYTC